MLDVKVKIDLLKPTASLDWGYPLIVSKGDKVVAYTECASIADVVAAGFAETTDTYKLAAVMFAQNPCPAKIAVGGLTAVTAESLAAVAGESFRQVVLAGEYSEEELTTGITYISASNDKIIFVGCKSATEAQALTASDRVVAVVHKTEAQLAAAAVAGATAGYEVGSITYKNIIINGITPENLTETEITAIHEANAITILKKAGDIVTSEGFVTSGEYVDVVDCKDYIIQQITNSVQGLLNSSAKIPYDDRGIAQLENCVFNILKSAYNKGMIAVDAEGNPLYAVNFALRSEVPEGDIAARKYKGGQFAFTLAGAVHEVEVVGEISVA